MIAEFIGAMRGAGISFDDGVILADGQLHRVHVDGDKAGTRNAWYVLHGGDFPAGAFGCNKRGISGKWRADGKRPSLTECDYTRIEADRKARAESQERGYNEAATRAERILQLATRDASGHAYVLRKGIRPHGVKMNRHGFLVVPIFSALNGLLQTVQMIANDGSKKMLTGGRMKNGCFPFQDTADFWNTAHHRIGIAEGFATGSTLAETLHETATFAAFSAGNLKAVAQGLRARYPNTQIIIFGDNDANQIGQRYAMEAARAVDGFIAIPPTTGYDWNDMLGAA